MSLNLSIDTLTDTNSAVLGTVAALVVFIAIIAIALLGVLITIFVIVKKKLKIRSGEAQFTTEAATQRYYSSISYNINKFDYC